MTQPKLSRHALSLAVVALVAACGGGADAPSAAAQEFSAALAAQPFARTDRLRALAVSTGGGAKAAAATVTITNAQLFAGAEAIFPELFPVTPAPVSINNLPYEGKVFQVKAYANGNYLGIGSDGNLYGLGPYTGGVLTNFGAVQSYADMVCSRISCGGTPGGGGGTGALNGCAEGASVALRTGNRYTATYLSSVLVAPTSTSEYQFEGVVEGPATFEGQSVIRSRNKVTGSQFGTAMNSEVLSYQQAGDNDLTKTIGTEASATVSGYQSTTKLVYNPASVNTEFTLAVGGSLTKTETMTTTTSFVGLPYSPEPTTTSTTSTYTYEARETISVLGRSWDTCRYKQTTQGTPGTSYTWVIFGKGFAAKTEQRNDAGTTEYRSELKSATVNGAAL